MALRTGREDGEALAWRGGRRKPMEQWRPHTYHTTRRRFVVHLHRIGPGRNKNRNLFFLLPPAPSPMAASYTSHDPPSVRRRRPRDAVVPGQAYRDFPQV